MTSPLLGWITISADWSNAFTQATSKKPICIAVPRGFQSKHGSDGCSQLLKSLCRSRLAPKNWWQLNDLHLKEISANECLLHKKDSLLTLHAGDTSVVALARREIIDDFIQRLRNPGFDLDIESDFFSHLGMGIEELPGGSWHMTQKGLIRRVLAATDMENCDPNWCPATQPALGGDPDDKVFDRRQFSCPSLVGMLPLLRDIAGPDVALAWRFPGHATGLLRKK